MSVQSKMLPIALSVLALGALGLIAGAGGRTDQPSVNKTAASTGKPATKTRPHPAATAATSPATIPVITRTSRTAEQSIRRALQTTLDVKFKQTPLIDVLQLLAKKGDFNLIVERKLLIDEGISLEDSITEDLKQVTIRQVLDWTLRPLGLTWVIEDEVLKVTTIDEAAEKLYTRTYNVKALLDLERRYLKEHPDAARSHLGNTTFGFSQFRPKSNIDLMAGNTPKQPKTTVSSSFGRKAGKSGRLALSPPVFIATASPPHGQRPRTALFQYYCAGSGICLGSGGTAGFPGTTDESDKPVDWLINLIENTTSSKWEDIDGEGGTIGIMRDVLSVRQTRVVHEEILSLLAAIEGMAVGKTKQGTIAVHPAGYPQKDDDAIAAALRKPVSVEYIDTPLSSVLAEIAAHHHIRLRIKYDILEDEGITTDAPVTLHANKVTLRSVLHLILEPIGLASYIADGAVWVTTISDAEEKFVTVVYDVRDLVQDDYDDLIELITTETSGKWIDIDGEGGSIVTAEAVGSLVIRQTAGMHNEVAALLADLRKKIAEIPNTPKPKIDPQEAVTRVYNLGDKAVAEEWSKAVRRLIAPKTWGDAKNAGIIQKVGTTLIIRHTRAVHRQIDRLLISYNNPVNGSPPDIGAGLGLGGGGKSGAGGPKGGTSGTSSK